MAEQVQARALPNFKSEEQEPEAKPVGILMAVDLESRNLDSFKVLGMESFEFTTSELIGWIEICKARLVASVAPVKLVEEE